MSETESTAAPAQRKEYTLKKAINQGGDEKQPGDKVMLRDDQAARLKEKGCI